MHRIVPELIVENYRAGRFKGEFPAVGMFLDLSGFSSMTDALMQHGQHGAEVLASLMHGVFDPLVEGIFGYGGKIVSFAGDGIMALYPIEADEKTSALRALTSAWLIQKSMIENPERKTVYGRFTFSIKIGLTLGSVSWGILRSGDQKQATYYFRGPAVEDSADAEHRAEAGEIILTDNIYEPLRDVVETDLLGSFHRFCRLRVELPEPSSDTFPPIDLEVSRVFMPEEVIAHDMRGEFRQVVNLFMRFPDLPNDKLEKFIHTTFELRKKYGGLLTRVDFGDKGCNMLMLWGAPIAYENDIGRALNFILDLQAGADFPITAGITYYIAHAGYLGSGKCEDYTCYGWGVNLASRFMMSAPAGAVWMDGRIARRLSTRFDAEYIGSQHFKGFSAEQKVYALKNRSEVDEVVYQGEMVGREDELAVLKEFAEPLWRGGFADILLITGDAGIGKGRLVHEFRFSDLFESHKALWAMCQSDQILRRSFNPLRRWLLRYFGLSTSHSPEERTELFEAKLSSLLQSIPDSGLKQELIRTQSFLGALVDIYWQNSLYEQLDAEGRYNNTFLALIALLKAESSCQPIILFLDDFQFADEDTKSFLPRLRRSVLAGSMSYPIAVIVTSRLGGVSLANDMIHARIDLHGLPKEEVASLAEYILGGAVSPELNRVIVEKSEGNPYFVEQIIRYFQEEGVLEMSREGWSPIGKPRETILPGDIRAVLIARLDQLTHEVRETIQTAAVLGREFEVRVLSQMLRNQDWVWEHIVEAEKAAVWVKLTEIRYLFSHGLLRDAAYTMQMRARRRELHTLAMDALETLYADSLNGCYAELAYHAEAANIAQKAQKYYILAGQEAADLFQNSQGAEYFTRALIFVPIDDLATRFDLLAERLELYKRLGDRNAQLKDLNSLQQLARRLDDPRYIARVHMLFVHYYILSADYPAVIKHAEHVLELRNTVEDPDVILDTYSVWPLALLRQGKLDDAMKTAQEGRRVAQYYNSPIKEGFILNSMGLIAIEQKDPGVAHEYLERALSIAKETGDQRLMSRTLGNLGYSAGFVRQDYASAHEYFEAGYKLTHERGERSMENVALGNLGWVAGMLGDLRAARSHYERSLVIAREVGNIYIETYALINLSAVTGTGKEAHASLDYAQKALALSLQTGERSGVAWSLLYMGYAYMSLNEPERAKESFERSIIIRDELGQPGLKTESLAGLIHAALAGDDLVGAMNNAQKIVSYLDNGGTLEGTEEPLRVYHACYLAFDRNKDPRASQILRDANELLDIQVSKLKGEDAGRRFIENIPWRFALWQAWHEHRN